MTHTLNQKHSIMSDRFVPISLPVLFRKIISHPGDYFGIPHEVFWQPEDNFFETRRFGKTLATPVGPAAGPHTQLSQNIVGAWLCGARYMELKTIQTLDELEVSKPCIDMQDEGYNCEWSQELRIHQSFDQYLDAWIIIHLLEKHLQWKDAARHTLFNMSVGYNLEGILQPNVQWFFDKMNNCSAELEQKLDELAREFPWVKDVEIPHCISDNVTLSTMHGCPPDEIEKIGLYLIKERGLHTVIKLNPTLLGPEKVREILNNKLGYETPVPDQAFEHDLKYPDALRIIENLSNAAAMHGVTFGLKLTNTLESNNFRSIFSDDQKQMYMSGRALHPLAVNLAHHIRSDFPHMDISFSAGADCFNVHELLACNLSPVTVSSDLLKPGGYGRMTQYLKQIRERLTGAGSPSVSQWMQADPAGRLDQYSSQVTDDEKYRKALREPNIKTLRPLGYFDCIHAPCMSTCPGSQDIPLYMHYASQGNWQKAFEVIMQTNPFPTITGKVCDHDCQSKCTRINYDSTLAIREIKRYVASFENNEQFIRSLPSNGQKAAIIGAGPAGLSCAWYLKLAGFEVDVYEEKEAAGGMVQQVIPDFRMTLDEIEPDIRRIEQLGITMHYNTPVTGELFEALRRSGVWIFAGIGARKSVKLKVPGGEAPQVKDPLMFLEEFKKDSDKRLDAKNILIIGGGNTAMDVARTARHFAGEDARVRIIYRRTFRDMPASVQEIREARDEGVEMHELLAPHEVVLENGQVKALQCLPMKTHGRDASGRSNVKPVEGQIIAFEADMIIPAVGQGVGWGFVADELMKPGQDGYSTAMEKIFVGGDARAGASNIISAIADGRKAAQIIASKAGGYLPGFREKKTGKVPARELLIKKTTRELSNLTARSEQGVHIPVTSNEEAMEEATRCLLCDEICNVCVGVCPNFANQSFEMEPVKYHLQTALQHADGNVSIEEGPVFEVTQKHQVYNIADYCNECGNCRTFCPTMGAPYKDKPTLHLTDESWEAAGSGFLISYNGDETGIDYKDEQGRLHVLFGHKNSDSISYKTDNISAELNTETLRIESIRFLHKKACEADLSVAARMFVLLKYLPVW